ncbi:MAG: mannose-1-phosphate guanyltransferase [Candidatus Magasanikbacteria bacterium]|nr:mannose-1-phosphate guanyltransferase [Candidatus Magasanikbacteria bacterium]
MARVRLTITLSPNVIKSLDSVIDKKTIRNRSHAIEYLLSQQFLSKVTKVVILAGGAGVKMQPLTLEMPKALLPVRGEPLLFHTLRTLREAGLKDIILSVGNLGEKIQEHFGDGGKLGVRLTYVKQKKENGTAQPVRALKALVGSDPFLLLYGDVLADINWVDLVNFHHTHDALATLAVTSVADTRGWGVVAMDGTRITRFMEKPDRAERSHLIFAGAAVLDPKVLDRIGAQTRSLEKEVLSELAKEKKISGYNFSGAWFDVGTPEDFARAVSEWHA